MGRGQIIAHKGDGLYDVRLIYAYRSRITDRLATYTTQMAELDTKIAAETDPNKLALLKLQRASIQKLYDYYSTNMPADPTVEAWCADLTEDLTGNVGTIEIPGEQVTVIVRPGYNNRAVYTSARDGQMMPAIAGSPHQVLFNWMLLPGWQRHKPVYRTGTIITGSIDNNANTCSVCLEPAYSSQQYLPAVDGLAVGECGTTNQYASQVSTFCSNYPGHPFCTNTDEGSEINLTDAQLAQLKTVNQYVNQNYNRQNDPSGLALGDSWDVMSPGGAGDCEDFALTKMQKLVDDYGWNPANLKMVTSYTADGTGHAFLAVRTSNKGLVALDVNYDNVIESGKMPYRVDKIAMTKDTWRAYTRRMDAVTVEYMTCNSWAFADGDRVVVKFTDQDWTKPKVVGFAENPQSCELKFWLLFQDHQNCAVNQNISYNVITDVFAALGGSPAPEFRARAAGALASASIYVGGGFGQTCDGGSPDAGETTARFNRFATNTSTWSVLSNLPTVRCGLMAGSSGGLLFFFGGFNQQYDAKATTPDGCVEDGEYYSSFTQSVAPFFSDNNQYNPTGDAWTEKQVTNNDRGMGGPFSIGQLIFASGGIIGEVADTELAGTCFTSGSPPSELPITIFEDQYQFTDEVDRHSVSGDSWSAMTQLSSARAGHSSAQLGAFGYIFGGRSHTSMTDDDFHMEESLDGYNQWQTYSAAKYDQAGNAWSTIQKLPVGYPDYTPSFGDLPAAASYDSIFVTVYPSEETSDYIFAKYSPTGNSYQLVGVRADLDTANDHFYKKAGSIGFIT